MVGVIEFGLGFLVPSPQFTLLLVEYYYVLRIEALKQLPREDTVNPSKLNGGDTQWRYRLGAVQVRPPA